LLLTAQRRDNVATMRWEEVTDLGWIIPAQKFKTGQEQVVPLTEVVEALLGDKRKKGFVFPSDGGKRAFSGYSKSKKALDARIAAIGRRARRPLLPHWVLHDLPRTARSLMLRAGVPADHAERVLGHAITGVRAIYDRHAFVAEKRDALQRLANLVDRILNPTDVVVPFAKEPLSLR
jgi:integrase